MEGLGAHFLPLVGLAMEAGILIPPLWTVCTVEANVAGISEVGGVSCKVLFAPGKGRLHTGSALQGFLGLL